MKRRDFLKLVGAVALCPELPTPKTETIQGVFYRFEYSGGKIAKCYPKPNHPCSGVLKIKYQAIRMTPNRWEETKKLFR